MLQRLYEQREPVGVLHANLNSDIVPLTSLEYKMNDECLTPFKLATTEMSEEQCVGNKIDTGCRAQTQ